MVQHNPVRGGKTYGPYWDKSAKRFYVVTFPPVKGFAQLHSRFLMEQHLGRLLHTHETVDHIDRNSLNDELSNLRVVGLSQHSKDDARLLQPLKAPCIWCGTMVIRKYSKSDVKRDDGINSSGPFCSRSCQGKGGAAISHRKMNRLPPLNPVAVYTLPTK